MPGLTDILEVILFAIFAIASIIFIFAVAGNVFNAIVEAFQRSLWAGLGMLSLCGVILVGFVALVQFATPYVVTLYHQIVS
jgi:hypothetical protein